MNRTISFLTSVVFCLSLGGCIVHERGRGRQSSARNSRCHPGQHWDGHQCRHPSKNPKNKHKNKKHH